MQSKTFSQLSFLVVVIVSGFVLVYIARQAASTVPVPEFLTEATSTPSSVVSFATTSIKVSSGTIQALVAKTSAERERGLGGRASLSDESGMLFVFEEPGTHGIWMKDMNFPIDIVWLRADKRVAGVDRRISPETYPHVFYPPAPAAYVLELSSGGAAKWGIATGTQLVF